MIFDELLQKLLHLSHVQGMIWLPTGSRFSLKMCSGNYNLAIGIRLAPKILKILLIYDRSNSLNILSSADPNFKLGAELAPKVLGLNRALM